MESWIPVLLITLVVLFLLWTFLGGTRQEHGRIIREKSVQKFDVDELMEDVQSPEESTQVAALPIQTYNGYYIPGTRPLRDLYKYELPPKGVSWKTEGMCRQIMEELYQLPFPRILPEFLRNPETGRLLELDCANLDINVALEYNGEQHYVFPNVWHKSKADFMAQLRRDVFKIEVCERVGLYLIVVPYTVPRNKSSLREYILNHIDPARFG